LADKIKGNEVGEEKLHKVLVGKHEEKSPLRRLRFTWEDGSRMDLRETVWGV
jgi:hypothetical protein